VNRWLLPAWVGALALLVSLYLPWQQASEPTSAGPLFFGGSARGPVAGLLNLFSGRANLNVEGWSSAVSGAAALSALLLATLVVVGVVRPLLLNRLPIGLCGLLVGYFAFAVAAAARSNAHYREVGYRQIGGPHFHYAYGAYLGVAGGVVALLAAGWVRRNEIFHDRSAPRVAAVALAAGLLVSLLLPWARFTPIQRVTLLGIESPAGALAAVAICAAAVWRTTGSSAGTLALSATAVLLVGAAVSGVTLGVVHSYGAWVGLGLGLAFVASALVDSASELSGQAGFGRHARAVLGAIALFLTALFLPWQKVCYPTGSGLGPYSGRCPATNGWVTIPGSTAAILSLLIALTIFVPRRYVASAVELAVGTALFVATLGFELVPSEGLGLHFGYGSIVGFSAAALLLILVAARLRLPQLGWNRLLVRLVPIAACLGYLAILVVPWWAVLPRRVQSESLVRFASISWLTVAGVLLGIHLLGSWLRRAADASASPDRLVLLPLALLALAALDLIRLRSAGITWGGGIVVGLCLVLALLGHVEAQSGLENMQIPEILRVDRL
jgi:hypothetical protein